MKLSRLFRRTPPALPAERVHEIRRDVYATLQTALQERDDARSELGAVTEQLEAAQAEIVRLDRLRADAEYAGTYARQSEKRLTTELAKMTSLASDQAASLRAAEVEIRQLEQRLADSATECVCGGDAELHWRKKTVEAERQALLDRANARKLANRLAQAEGRPVIGSLA